MVICNESVRVCCLFGQLGYSVINLRLTCALDLLAGVVGSIIHYPKDMAEMATEIKGSGYSTL